VPAGLGGGTRFGRAEHGSRKRRRRPASRRNVRCVAEGLRVLADKPCGDARRRRRQRPPCSKLPDPRQRTSSRFPTRGSGGAFAACLSDGVEVGLTQTGVRTLAQGGSRPRGFARGRAGQTSPATDRKSRRTVRPDRRGAEIRARLAGRGRTRRIGRWPAGREATHPRTVAVERVRRAESSQTTT
jgi:hypothetical protein